MRPSSGAGANAQYLFIFDSKVQSCRFRNRFPVPEVIADLLRTVEPAASSFTCAYKYLSSTSNLSMWVFSHDFV